MLIPLNKNSIIKVLLLGILFSFQIACSVIYPSKASENYDKLTNTHSRKLQTVNFSNEGAKLHFDYTVFDKSEKLYVKIYQYGNNAGFFRSFYFGGHINVITDNGLVLKDKEFTEISKQNFKRLAQATVIKYEIAGKTFDDYHSISSLKHVSGKISPDNLNSIKKFAKDLD